MGLVGGLGRVTSASCRGNGFHVAFHNGHLCSWLFSLSEFSTLAYLVMRLCWNCIGASRCGRVVWCSFWPVQHSIDEDICVITTAIVSTHCIVKQPALAETEFQGGGSLEAFIYQIVLYVHTIRRIAWHCRSLPCGMCFAWIVTFETIGWEVLKCGIIARTATSRVTCQGKVLGWWW